MLVVLSNDSNFKWHLPIWEKIYRPEQKYMPFFGTVAERVFWKKNPKHRNIYKSSQCCALDFFSENTLGDGPAFWTFFFQDSRIRINSICISIIIFVSKWPTYNILNGYQPGLTKKSTKKSTDSTDKNKTAFGLTKKKSYHLCSFQLVRNIWNIKHTILILWLSEVSPTGRLWPVPHSQKDVNYW